MIVDRRVYEALAAAARVDRELTELIGTDEYPNALTDAHTHLRIALLIVPPTLGCVE